MTSNRKTYFETGVSPKAGGRGRPATNEHRNVAEDIIIAAEACLTKRNSIEISTKEIAALAGTRQAMIYYYYGSKDGLLAEIIRRHLKGILHGMKRLREAIRRNEVLDPTRAMIGLLAASYNERPALCRIVISELLHEDSPVRRYLMQQRPFYAHEIFDDAIVQLTESGYYRKDVNSEDIIVMMRSVVFFPLISKFYLEPENKAVECRLDDRWIDFVSTVFDCYLRPQR